MNCVTNVPKLVGWKLGITEETPYNIYGIGMVSMEI